MYLYDQTYRTILVEIPRGTRNEISDCYIVQLLFGKVINSLKTSYNKIRLF